MKSVQVTSTPPPEKQKFKSFQLNIMRKNFPDKKSKNFYTLNFIKFQQFWSSNTNKLVKMEKFTPQCRWQRRQFSPLIPDCLKTFQTVCKISTLSGNLPKWAEAFQTVWYISLLCLDIILWSILLVRAKTFWSAIPTRQRDFWDSEPPHD